MERLWPRTREEQIDYHQRFWDKVDKNGPVPVHRPELGQCWVWAAATNGRYGTIGTPGRSSKPMYAHRAAYEIQIGPIPDGLWVLHQCDRPLCVRGGHLYVGTATDNNRDAVLRGRHQVGPMAITREQGDEIRDAYVDEVSMAHLAKEYGVSKATIWRAVHDEWPE